jgi:hypothetical protein
MFGPKYLLRRDDRVSHAGDFRLMGAGLRSKEKQEKEKGGVTPSFFTSVASVPYESVIKRPLDVGFDGGQAFDFCGRRKRVGPHLRSLPQSSVAYESVMKRPK